MDLFGYNAEHADNEEYYDNGLRIKVIGVGTAGGNAVNRILDFNIRGVECIAVDCDRQPLMKSNAKTKVIIGERITNGHGASSKPDIGSQAAEENIEDLRQILSGTHIAFIVAGMGGGTGTGASPVIARVAKDMGIRTIGIVTTPFAFEGLQRMRCAEAGIEALTPYVDHLIVIPNEQLKNISEVKITLTDAFSYADAVMCRCVQSVAEPIRSIDTDNLTFADLSSLIEEIITEYTQRIPIAELISNPDSIGSRDAVTPIFPSSRANSPAAMKEDVAVTKLRTIAYEKRKNKTERKK